jgi:hypothetical protein
MTASSSQETTSTDPAARGRVLGWGLVSVAIGAVVALFVGRRAPDFAVVWAGFGESLPLATKLVLGWWYLLWLIPAAALVVSLTPLRHPDISGSRRRRVRWLVALAASAVVLGVVAIAALYAPAFVGEPI